MHQGQTIDQLSQSFLAIQLRQGAQVLVFDRKNIERA